jgi:hypothetical protein
MSAYENTNQRNHLDITQHLLANMSNSSSGSPAHAIAINPMHSAANVRLPSSIRLNRATFYDLSEDNLIIIESFLSATDICRLQATCKMGADTSAQPEVWDTLLKRDFLGGSRRSIERTASARYGTAMRSSIRSVRDAASSVLQRTGLLEQTASSRTSKQAYVQKYLEHKRVRQEARREQARRAEVAVAEDRGLTLRVVLDVLQYCCGLGTPCVLICLWLVLMLLKLCGSISIEWSHVWIPLWVMLGVVVCCGLLGCCTSIISDKSTTASMWHRQSEGDDYAIVGFATVILDNLGSRGWTLRFLWCLINVVLAFIIFPALVLAKLNDSVTGSWGLVFVPVWLIFALWCCLPCATNELAHEVLDDRDAIWYVWIISLVVLWTPLLCVLIMVVVRLDGKFIAAALMFIPFYIADFLMIAVCCFVCILAMVDDDDDDRPKELAVASVLFVCLGTFLPLQIYASIYDDKNGEFPVVGTIAPLIAAMCLISCVSCYGVLRLWKSSREEHFSNAWSLSRCSCRRMRPSTPILPGADMV